MFLFHIVHIVVHVILIAVVVVHVITVVVRTVVILVWPGVHDVISHVDITEVAVVVIFVSDKFSSESLPPTEFTCKQIYLSQNAKRASARKDTGLDQSLFSVQLFRLRINFIKVCKESI